MAARGTGKRRKRTWLKWAAAAVLLAFLLLGVAITVAIRRAEPMLRAAIVEKLEEHFHARVELDSFHVSLISGLWAEGKGLRIWPPVDMPGVTVEGPNGTVVTKPLITLGEFRFHTPLRYKPGEPIRIAVVQLNGLNIDLPPKPLFKHAHAPAGTAPGGGQQPMLSFLIRRIECYGAHLTIQTSKPGKLPLEFDIAKLQLHNVSLGGSMHFDAQLTNPRPAGIIFTSGSLGPWVVEDPGETPVEGGYRFEHADLAVFKGIAGILNSTGKYQGVLRNLEVDGQTSTPDFRLTHFGTAMPLETTFHATVDGTNGDTWLHPVRATLGQSRFTAEGQIVGIPSETLPNGTGRPGGRQIAMNVIVNGGRMEDFMRLVSKNGTPLMTGELTLKTKLEIAPGTEPVEEKIELNGSFELEDAAFTSAKVQNDVGELSMRGQGEPKDAKNAGDEVRSAIVSNFTMANGVITLPNLKYTAPGAEIDLAGKYGLDASTLDFKGTAQTEATVSQMVGGWKGILLKPADRFFKKHGAGTLVPIHVDGTEQDPHFGIDFGRIEHTSPQTPGQTQ
ncbi:MAG: AsmA-like C-terminal region-containing protein [Terracidiphilus sp.]